MTVSTFVVDALELIALVFSFSAAVLSLSLLGLYMEDLVYRRLARPRLPVARIRSVLKCSPLAPCDAALGQDCGGHR